MGRSAERGEGSVEDAACRQQHMDHLHRKRWKTHGQRCCSHGGCNSSSSSCPPGHWATRPPFHLGRRPGRPPAGADTSTACVMISRPGDHLPPYPPSSSILPSPPLQSIRPPLSSRPVHIERHVGERPLWTAAPAAICRRDRLRRWQRYLDPRRWQRLRRRRELDLQRHAPRPLAREHAGQYPRRRQDGRVPQGESAAPLRPRASLPCASVAPRPVSGPPAFSNRSVCLRRACPH